MTVLDCHGQTWADGKVEKKEEQMTCISYSFAISTLEHPSACSLLCKPVDLT